MTSPTPATESSVARVLAEACVALRAARNAEGHWRGALSASALSTAVVTIALAYGDRRRQPDPAVERLVRRGLDWLAANANDDGGYGDTVRSRSNLPTTLLCWASLSHAVDAGETSSAAVDETWRAAHRRAGRWIEARTGSLTPDVLGRTIDDLYGSDKTFSVPILTLCALAGVLGDDDEAFGRAVALPFELALLPRRLFRFVGLPVVSYALPALIAVGQVQHHRRPTRLLPLRWLRAFARGRTLRLLRAMQPSSGGFLEATPLTGFVALSLAGAGQADHPVVDHAFDFFRRSVLDDGSWPIDVDLATWVTTLAVHGLTAAGRLGTLDSAERTRLLDWLLDQQHRARHPFTDAAPGGWGWTDLPGGVPDADDTPGTLLALAALVPSRRTPAAATTTRVHRAVRAGVRWLVDLQNRDGGMPTFCRGWGRLPFDRSSPDLTAHSLRAFTRWHGVLPPALRRRVARARRAALRYLARVQQVDGAWVPLWFGNEAADANRNMTYGTAKVVVALTGENRRDRRTERMLTQGVRYLLGSQNQDGGWGGGDGTPSSVEETALAVEALAAFETEDPALAEALVLALTQGAEYLVTTWDRDGWQPAAPIGFYFANLWYYEALYPLVFGVAALGRVRRRLDDTTV